LTVGHWHSIFILGVLTWHLFRKTSRSRCSIRSRLCWAIVTDCLSCFWAGLVIKVYLEPNFAITGDGRKWLSASTVVCSLWWRVTPLLVLWMYGLAVGEGLTARICSCALLVRFSSLSYAIYLFHCPVAWCYYYLVFGTEFKRWMQRALDIPFDMPVWPHLPMVIVLTFAVAWFVNEHGRLDVFVPLCMRGWDLFLRVIEVICCCCLCRRRAKAAAGATAVGSFGALGDVQRSIRRLTSASTTPDTALESVGLDSFGLSALLGVLRATPYPAARKLRLATLQELGTVGALANFLEGHSDTKKKV